MFGGGGSDENAYLVGGIQAGFNPDRSGIIIVYGNGGRDSKYYDAAPGSPMDGHEMAETTITQELIPAIDHTFRTIQSREGRAIMGLSGGGLASLRLAFKYPELFVAIRPTAAAIFPTAAEAFNALGDNVGYWMFNNDASYYEAGTPYTLAVQNADRIKSLGLGIHMQIGGDDGLLDNNQRLIQVLDSVGIPHEDLVIVPGVGHDWAAWGNGSLPVGQAIFVGSATPTHQFLPNHRIHLPLIPFPFHHLHGQAFCIASTARTRKSSCIRSGRASMYVTATRAF
jgi:S-formylglutathione hydrolase FrmB